MNRGAKRISNSLRPKIQILKGYIRESTRGFDGDGYVFKQAIRELKKEGIKIVYDKTKCLYMKVFP